MTALLVSNVLLWVVVLLMGAVILALVRQMGVLFERVAPVGALALGSSPAPGETAPVLIVSTLSGSIQKLGGKSTNDRSTLLFFLSPTCPVCKTLLPALKSLAKDERAWLDVVLASDGPREDHARFVSDHRLREFPYTVSTELGLAYRVGRLPHAVLIDEGGIITSAGLVNSREHLESLLEARERGVGTLQEYLEANPSRGGRVTHESKALARSGSRVQRSPAREPNVSP